MTYPHFFSLIEKLKSYFNSNILIKLGIYSLIRVTFFCFLKNNEERKMELSAAVQDLLTGLQRRRFLLLLLLLAFCILQSSQLHLHQFHRFISLLSLSILHILPTEIQRILTELIFLILLQGIFLSSTLIFF